MNFYPFVIGNCNPNNTWVKSEFYDHYIEKNLPKNVYFQESNPADNPTLSESYLDILNSLPKEEKERYLFGSWDYLSQNCMLIPSDALRACLIEPTTPADGQTYLAIDPADDGRDSTVFCYMRGQIVYEFEVFAQLNEIKTAKLAQERAIELAIKPYNIIVDAVGIGAGCYNTLIEAGLRPIRFIGGESAVQKGFLEFKNKRTESAWLLRQAILDKKIKIVKNQRLQNEIANINYFVDNDRTITLEKKLAIRSRLGHSPDCFDALCMLNYLKTMRLNAPLTAFSGTLRR